MARLAFLLPDMRGGGAERVTVTLVHELVRRGHEVDLVLMRAKGDLLALLPPGIKIIDLKASRIRGGLRPLINYLRARRPEALQARMWPLTVIAILAGLFSRSGTRVVVSDHNNLAKQYGGSWSAMAALRATTRFIYPLAAARICVSEGCAADLARLSGLRPNLFTVIHNPVFPPDEPATPSPDTELIWSGAKRRILTVGSLKAQKNQALLIRAFALLDRDLDAKLLIVGEGPLRAELGRLAEKLGVADRVVLLGFSADPWPFYRTADLFVLSSDYEGFGNVLVEAILGGLPVVSTDCPSGPREILDDGRLGRLVPVGNVEALAHAIATSLAEPHDPVQARNRMLRISTGNVERYVELMVGSAG